MSLAEKYLRDRWDALSHSSYFYHREDDVLHSLKIAKVEGEIEILKSLTTKKAKEELKVKEEQLNELCMHLM